jgi:hypothetical protein
VLAYLLLQDRSDVGVGGARGQSQNGSGLGVSQGHRGDEGRLGGGAKAATISGVQGRLLGLPESAAVSGHSVPAIPGRKWL